VLARKSLLPLSVSEIKKTIATLERLEMVAKGEDGIWRPTLPTLSTGSGLQEKILRQAQMIQLEHIRDDLLHDSEGRPPRKVTTSLVSISGPGLERILLRMDRLRSEIRALAHRDPNPADRVYLVAIAAVPLSYVEKP